MHILIAEDDPTAATVLRHAIVRNGHTCDVARDGIEALAALRAGSFDMVISDWQMPNMDGVELCQATRALPDVASVYFIIVTTNAQRGRFREALRCGADDYITKPISSAALSEALNAAARLRNVQRSLGDTTAALDGVSITKDTKPLP